MGVCLLPLIPHSLTKVIFRERSCETLEMIIHPLTFSKTNSPVGVVENISSTSFFFSCGEMHYFQSLNAHACAKVAHQHWHKYKQTLESSLCFDTPPHLHACRRTCAQGPWANVHSYIVEESYPQIIFNAFSMLFWSQETTEWGQKM